MGDVSEQTQDFAIEAWHEDGRWSIASLPDPDDLTHIIDRLKKQQTNGGAVALITIDDEFFLAIRVLGTHVKFFISDVSCAIDYEVAAEFLELADLDQPDEEDEPLPAGDLDIFSDLGLHSMELSTLCDDADLFPDEQIEAIANRLGFSEQLTELLES
ncbi:tRNA adenosine deaminase-associated protein [Candidatus Planktophila dulcis]|uniref:tRNA adenosine deaminase-associated protein n=3 Tax=root TaxID=1 RepID=A0AAC9YV15_9ACTN|nr:tRNA adenosine deaminase-associated protein [Candidatus Planktophila dulcis]ASY15328.1 tRNA adenosine deaminase-associated protein [Candidatus Planktophila dulcis]